MKVRFSHLSLSEHREIPGSQRGSTGLGLVVGPVVLGKRAGSGALKLLKRPARLERRLVAER